MAYFGDVYIRVPVEEGVPPDLFDGHRYVDPDGPHQIMALAKSLWDSMGRGTIHPHLVMLFGEFLNRKWSYFAWARGVIDALCYPPDAPPLSNHQQNCIMEDTRSIRAYNIAMTPGLPMQDELDSNEPSDQDFYRDCLRLLGDPEELTEHQEQFINQLKHEREMLRRTIGGYLNVGTVLAHAPPCLAVPRSWRGPSAEHNMQQDSNAAQESMDPALTSGIEHSASSTSTKPDVSMATKNNYIPERSRTYANGFAPRPDSNFSGFAAKRGAATRQLGPETFVPPDM